MFKNKLVRFFIFLLCNFAALGLGIFLMQDGPRTNWYLELNKAPWTPANWVFGTAWSAIMVFFSFYMTKLSFQYQFLDKKLIILYTIQWILNVGWNFLFFNKHLIITALFAIIFLWLLIGYFTFEHQKKLRFYTLFILPYLVWMTIATSLNAYIVFNN
ncbi:TspO/MBR family protein [Aquimarina sp. I32.4]|uniref:TspO/MBR family protein n=1 Tax=Aquimarina sp. I32.4 TaxID=2053903 RepID=UPI000CDF2582|nr:TspO/MBR family protein [Aquimarina sp. I32.4]